MAERIEWVAPAHMLSGAIVPAPAAQPGDRGAAFDPASELASALAERLGSPVNPCIERVPSKERRRSEHPSKAPAVRLSDAPPRSVLLLDDALASGEILTACARALRAGGASRVVAVTFARRL